MAVFTTSRHTPGAKIVWPVVRSTASVINYGRASAAPGPAGPGPGDSLNILDVFTLFKQSNLPAPLTVRLTRHLKQFGHTSVRDARACGADEPTRHAGLGDRAGALTT